MEEMASKPSEARHLGIQQFSQEVQAAVQLSVKSTSTNLLVAQGTAICQRSGSRSPFSIPQPRLFRVCVYFLRMPVQVKGVCPSLFCESLGRYEVLSFLIDSWIVPPISTYLSPSHCRRDRRRRVPTYSGRLEKRAAAPDAHT